MSENLAFTLLRAQAYNNAWANHRLLSACSQLEASELAAKRTGFFPSILATLNHNLTVDWFYVSALEGDGIGYIAFEPEIPFSEMKSLWREQRLVDKRLVAVCDELSATALQSMVNLPRPARVQEERFDRTLLHLFQHQTHHRGQVHAMLAGTRVAPPQLDEFFLDDELERERRRDEFASLGFDEARIWR